MLIDQDGLILCIYSHIILCAMVFNRRALPINSQMIDKTQVGRMRQVVPNSVATTDRKKSSTQTLTAAIYITATRTSC